MISEKTKLAYFLMPELFEPQLLIQTKQHEYYYQLDRKKIWILGRQKDCDLVLPDRRISRKHALVKKIANHQFYYVDLDSRNGSFLNGRPVDLPTRLCHGDQITAGGTQLFFFHPLATEEDQEGTVVVEPNLPKRQIQVAQATRLEVDQAQAPLVLMVHRSKFQGEIWKQLLMAQGIGATWVPEIDQLTQYIARFSHLLKLQPHLLLIDIGFPKPSDYAFCRLCQQVYPDLKLVLLASDREAIEPGERHWAIRHGALELLPGFSTTISLHTSIATLTHNLNCVLSALNQQAIEEQVVRSLLLGFPKSDRSFDAHEVN